MKKRLISFGSILFLVTCFTAGCGIPQDEYDSVTNALSEAENRVAELQNQLGETLSSLARYEELKAEYQELKSQSEAKLNELITMESEYQELNSKFEDLEKDNLENAIEIQNLQAKYEDLEKQYNAVIAPPEEITEEDIEQTLFGLINQARIDNGEDELMWGINIFKVAQRNNHHMAEDGKYQYDQIAAIQEIFWAVGYNTVDEIANAALIAWSINPYRFEHYLLSKATTYGAVDAYISGDIIYITYIGATYR